MKQNILFVSGIPDNNIVTVVSTHPNGSVRYEHSGTCDIYNYMSPSSWNKQLLILDANPYHITLDPKTHCIVNQIAEADSHVKTLERVKTIMADHPQIPVFNPPLTIEKTRRDRVYETLKDIPGLRVPQTVRFQPKHLNDVLDCMQTYNMQYPLILKAAGMHGGVDTLRFDNLNQLKDGLYALALDGRSYYLIQFHDTSQNGVFSKFRFAMIKGKVYPRHMRFADEWMIHSENSDAFMTKYPEYYAKEKQLIENFPEGLPTTFFDVMAKIYERIPIDYVGMDITVDREGNVFVFELNPNMLILKTSEAQELHFRQAVFRLHEAIHQAINERIQNV